MRMRIQKALVEGQDLYLRECDPRRVATMVIDAS